MTLIGQRVLTDAGKRNAPLRKWLAAWTKTVEAAMWRSILEVRKDYPSADAVRLASNVVVTVFNAKGNEYRLLTLIFYAQQAVTALEVITHAEYDKQQWKNRY